MPLRFRRERVTARSLIVVTLILAALPLGCGSHPGIALVDPAKYQFHDCTQLARDLKPLRERAHELQALYQRAARDSGGAFVAKVTYEADYLTTIGDIELIETAMREKKCASSTAGDAPAAR
jgi:hypothetical protein